MMKAVISVDENIALTFGAHAVQLEADEALLLAAELSRCAFRHIATEEGADFLFDEKIESEGVAQ